MAESTMMSPNVARSSFGGHSVRTATVSSRRLKGSTRLLKAIVSKHGGFASVALFGPAFFSLIAASEASSPASNYIVFILKAEVIFCSLCISFLWQAKNALNCLLADQFSLRASLDSDLPNCSIGRLACRRLGLGPVATCAWAVNADQIAASLIDSTHSFDCTWFSGM